MTQQAAILAVQALIRTISGIDGAPNYPPEQIPNDYFPFVVAYPGDGEHSFGVQGERKLLGSIVIELHVARKDLPTAVEGSLPYGDSIPAKLMADPTLTATVDTFESISQSFGELGWGELQTLGFRFTINNIKQRSNL